VHEIYLRTLEDNKKDHQEQQLEMVKNGAQGINYLIEHISKDMKFLTVFPNITNLDSNSSPLFIDYFLSTYEPSLVRTIFFANRNGKIRYAAGEPYPVWSLSHLKQVVDLAQISGNNNYLLSPIIRDESIEDNNELYFIMLTPIASVQNNSDSSGLKYIGYFINFNILIDRFIKPLRLSKSDFAWVLDGTGRLIYHPNHEEMLFRSISDTTSECSDCHISFDTPKSMIAAKGPSIGEYSIIGDEPPKIIAYFPIEIQNQRWILVISTFLSDVTESLRDKFKLFFILGFVILGVIIFFSLLVYYMNSKRIRAEEAKRNLEQIQEFQEQLNQASKMASIGELADTLAHEINTPAGIIAAHADALILKNNHSNEIADTLNIIKRQTHRISEYTKSLLNYSQSMPFYPEQIDMEALINESVFLLDHRFRAKKITVIKKIESEHKKVVADRRQMEQVLINLLNNAVAALELPGDITISLRKIFSNSALEGKHEEEIIIISVEDNGIGIPEEYLNKIFDPFFSTKSKAEGTGLGLAITKAIIKRHKGKIEVTSKVGRGTVFKIFLPANTNGSKKVK
jgi:signal transduction histidine kinase